MKKVACILIEVEDSETVESIIGKIRNTLGETKVDQSNLRADDMSWQENLKTILAKLGINSYLAGYKYLFLAMEYIEKIGKNKHVLMREIYDYIQEQTGARYQHIERNVRTVAQKIYENNSAERVEEVLKLFNIDGRLQNSKFIAALADLLFN